MILAASLFVLIPCVAYGVWFDIDNQNTDDNQ